MKFRVAPRWPLPYHHTFHQPFFCRQLLRVTVTRNLHVTRSSAAGGSSSGSRGDSFLIPGATAATLLMLALLHARRLYEDNRVEDLKERGIELEFSPDVKASFLKMIPLRSLSRFWGSLTSVEIPLPLRASVYKAWARAFHTNLEEVALPLEKYASLRDFFVHTLKEGSRPIDCDKHCLVSPVDGTVLRCGELRGSGAMIDQVKGFSYSASSLLGANTFLPEATDGDANGVHIEDNTQRYPSKHSWWRISFASPKLRDPVSLGQAKGVFYCVIYLWPGDYHRVHSPIDWQIFLRRHFSGHLFPVNERATRTIKNLYVENERVVLEGQWKEGFMALAAIGATNIGSVQLVIEPELKTNKPKRQLHSEPPSELVYEPVGVGIMQKKGDELAVFNMGSTVVLVFQAPISTSPEKNCSSEFKFSIKTGDRVRVGEAIGRWNDF